MIRARPTQRTVSGDNADEYPYAAQAFRGAWSMNPGLKMNLPDRLVGTFNQVVET